MARSGPEDSLQAAQLPTNSSPELTAGPDWAIVRNKAVEASSLHYKDFAEAERLAALVESNGTESKILRDLADSRYVCTQPRFALQVRIALSWRRIKSTFTQHTPTWRTSCA